MHQAILYQNLPDKKVKCLVCPRSCIIPEGSTGYCRVRYNRDGTLFAAGFGVVSSMAADPIEKKPLFNFYPGTSVMSMGSLGCNFSCLHCQNWEISQADLLNTSLQTAAITPEQLIEAAITYECRGVAFTYNEPTINIEFAIESSRLAKQNGLYTVLVTNGYITESALDTIAPFTDAYCVDIKGFGGDFYRTVCNVPDERPVLDAAQHAREKWNIHVEVVTNLIPAYNDSEQQLTRLASWIHTYLGADTPWHISRFYPRYRLQEVAPTPAGSIERARAIGLSQGLRYVYAGNMAGDTGENTYCPNCGAIVIERAGYNIRSRNLNGNRCTTCEQEVAIIV